MGIRRSSLHRLAATSARCAAACVLVASISVPAEAPAQVAFRMDDGVEVELSGRLQLQARTSSCSDFPIAPDSPCVQQAPGTDLFLRRARVSIEVRLNDRITGVVEPDFAEVDGVALKDAWGRITLHPLARVQLGHFKRPFDGFQLTSSSRILTIERDLDVPGVSGLRAASLDEFTTAFGLSDRDIGVMLTGETEDGALAYWAGVFDGGDTPEGEASDPGKQFVGRVRFATEAAGLPLALAVAAALTDRPFTRTGGELVAAHYADFELWGELGDFSGGPHVQAGLVFGENPLEDARGGAPDYEIDERLADAVAWQVIGTWRLRVGDGELVEGIEPLLRVTWADPNRDLAGDENRGLTPGVQVLFGNRNKIAVNWDIVTFAEPDLESASSFKAQYQFYF